MISGTLQKRNGVRKARKRRSSQKNSCTNRTALFLSIMNKY
ncbi:hypothetical protein SUBVAR_07358 [Subdoligranulum variabile DSM 15176]|uniref:Uncharacterized protein n=1 Tax=Subdoligranulum variabile DSM 15176 TaxID=411471 RepID=D1PSH5_9FIRM|nr:hypothetical protein SUBVAR_07358 [Subdoligranulum variabile DSM 15176]